MSVSQSQPVLALPGATGHVELSVSEDFAVVNRFGVTIATADSAKLARKTAKRLSRQFGGLSVQRVETTIRREVIYRPRSAS